MTQSVVIAQWENGLSHCLSSPYGPGLISGCDGVFQGIFPWLIKHTWRGDGRQHVVTDFLLKGFKEYQNIQFLLPPPPPTTSMLMGLQEILRLKSYFRCHLFLAFEYDVSFESWVRQWLNYPIAERHTLPHKSHPRLSGGTELGWLLVRRNRASRWVPLASD